MAGPTPNGSPRPPTFVAIGIAASCVFAALLWTLPLASAAPIAQSARIEVGSVTPWVTPDGTWTAQFETSALPLDGYVTVSVRRAVEGSETEVRETLSGHRDGNEPGRSLQPTTTSRVLEVADPDGRVTIEIGTRSGSGPSDRIRLPSAGLFPVVIAFSTVDDRSLGEFVLYLAYLGESPPPPLELSVITPVRSGPAFSPDGAVDVVEVATAAERQMTLAEAAGGQPLTVDLDPEVLVGLASSPRPEDAALLERLNAHLRSNRVLRAPWAPLHLEAWATSGRRSDLRSTLVAAQDAVAANARQLVDPRVWAPDVTFGPKSVSALAELDIRRALVWSDRLEPARAPRGEGGYSRPVRIQEPGSPVLEALVVDPVVQSLLASSDGDAGLRAHQVISLLAAEWFASPVQRRGSALVLSSAVPQPVATALLRTIQQGTAGPTPIVMVEPSQIFADVKPLTVRQSGRDAPWVRRVAPINRIPDVSSTSQRLSQLRERVAAAQSMLPEADPQSTADAVAMLQLTHSALDRSEVARYFTAVSGRVDEVLDAVETPSRRSVTVTSREARIPIRMSNSTSRPLRVQVRYESPRLVFLQGEVQDLTLKPGVNRIEVPVSVRSSGEFVLRATVRSRNSGMELARGQVRIRSTTFSGVGLILSGAALLVLVVWWGRTLRRSGISDHTPSTQLEGHA